MNLELGTRIRQDAEAHDGNGGGRKDAADIEE